MINRKYTPPRRTNKANIDPTDSSSSHDSELKKSAQQLYNDAVNSGRVKRRTVGRDPWTRK